MLKEKKLQIPLSSVKGYYVISFLPSYKRKMKTSIVHQLIIPINEGSWTWEDKNSVYFEYVFRDLPSLVQNFFSCAILTKEILKPQLITSWMDSNAEFIDMPWNFGNISTNEAKSILSKIPTWSSKGLFIGRKTPQGFAVCYLGSQDTSGKYSFDEVEFTQGGNKISRVSSKTQRKEEYDSLGTIFSCPDFKIVRDPSFFFFLKKILNFIFSK